MNYFVKERLESLKYTVKGLLLLFKIEHRIIAQSIFFLFIIAIGFILGILKQYWSNQIFSMGLFLSVKGLNINAEKISDFVHKEKHPKIEFIKDITAGTITFAMLAFFNNGLLN
jgi:diacylglycerol kinase